MAIETNEKQSQQTQQDAGATAAFGAGAGSNPTGNLGANLDLIGSSFSRISGIGSELLEGIRAFSQKTCDSIFGASAISVLTLSEQNGFPGIYPATVFSLPLEIGGKKAYVLYVLVHELQHQSLEAQKLQFGMQQIEIARNISDVMNDHGFQQSLIGVYRRTIGIGEDVKVEIGGCDFIPAKMSFAGIETEQSVSNVFLTGYLRQIFQAFNGLVNHASGNATRLNLATAKGNVSIRHEFGEKTVIRPNGLPVRVGQVSTLEYNEANSQNTSFAVANNNRVIARASSFVDFIFRGEQPVAPGQAQLPPLVPCVVMTDFNNGDFVEPRGLIYAILAMTGLYDTASFPWMNAFRSIGKKAKGDIDYRDVGVMALDRRLAPALGASEPSIVNTAGMQEHEVKNLLARVVDLNNMVFAIDVDSISSNSFINTTIHAAASGGTDELAIKANRRLTAWADEFTNGEFSKNFPAGKSFFKSSSLVLPRGYVPDEKGVPVDLRTYDFLGAMNMQAKINAKEMNGVGNDYAAELHNIYSNDRLTPLDRLIRLQKALRGVDMYIVGQTIRYFLNPEAVKALVIGAQKALAVNNQLLINKTQVGAYSNDSHYTSSFVQNSINTSLNWTNQYNNNGDAYGFVGSRQFGGAGIL